MDGLMEHLRHPAMPLEDPATMTVSSQQIRRAWQIKHAVASHLDKTLTDFDYVQWAICHPETPLPEILNHMRRIQAFEEEYHIQNTVEDAMAALEAVTELLPECFLSVQYNPPTGNCIGIADHAKFFPNLIVEQGKEDVYLRGLYYRLQAMNPTFCAIKVGISDLMECQGVGWDHLNASFLEHCIFQQLYMSYPHRYKEVFFVNSPTVINVACALAKRYMSDSLIQNIHLGYAVPGMEGRRIDCLFKTPTAEAGRQTLLQSCRRLLEVRYMHHASFVLPRMNNHQPQALQQQQQQQQQPPPPQVV